MASEAEIQELRDACGNPENKGKIKAPVHLYHGNEDKIINIFIIPTHLFKV